MLKVIILAAPLAADVALEHLPSVMPDVALAFAAFDCEGTAIGRFAEWTCAGVLFGALTYTLIDKIIAAAGVDALINDTIKGIILLGAVFLQLVGPMLKGVKLTDQVKEICGKWFAFGKTKKQLAAEAAEGGESALPSSEDDAVTEAEDAAERAVEEALDGAPSPEAAAEEIREEASSKEKPEG